MSVPGLGDGLSVPLVSQGTHGYAPSRLGDPEMQLPVDEPEGLRGN